MRFTAKAAFAAMAAAALAVVWSQLRRRSDPELAGGAAVAPAPAPTRSEPAAAPAPPAESVEGYCVKERKKVQIKDPVRTTTKNGRPAVRGTCPDCGSKIFRFLPQD